VLVHQGNQLRAAVRGEVAEKAGELRLVIDEPLGACA